MAGLDVNTKSFSQHDPAGPLKDDNLLVIAQPWAQGLKGYKTVNITLRVGYNTIIESLKQTGLPANLIDADGGIIGVGTVANPLRIDRNWVTNNYAIAAMVNVSQVGRLDRTTLPLGTAATAFSFPMNGLSMSAFIASGDDGSFSTLVPVTNGFDTTYNYGSGEVIGNNMINYETSEEPYMPKLPEGYDPADYWVEQIFSVSKSYMVIKLRHVSLERSKDQLAVVSTQGSLDGAYQYTYFLTQNNLYQGLTATELNPFIIESKMKYTAFEQNGNLYITRFDITVNDKTFGNKMDRQIGIVIYQLKALDPSKPYLLTPIVVNGFTTLFMGQTVTSGGCATLTEGYYGKIAAELDLSIVSKTQLEFKAIPMDGSSQAMDRFLDIYQMDDGTVKLRLSRTANFLVTRSNGTRQNFLVNYGFSYTIDMATKKLVAVEQDASKYRPKLVMVNNVYVMQMNKQEATLWNGAIGRMEVRTEDNLSITTPTTTSGTSTVTVRDETTGDPIVTGTIETVDNSNATIDPGQYSIPLSTASLGDSQDLMFITGAEDTGYRIGALSIKGEDNPDYTYTNAKGEIVHGYSLNLERFSEQRFIDGVDLNSYSTVYNCGVGEIFEHIDGYNNTQSQTRFGLISYTYEDLTKSETRTVIQREAEVTYSSDPSVPPNVDTTAINVFINHRAVTEWIRANVGYVDKGAIKIIPFFDGSNYKAFIHMSLVGGIGVGILNIHLIADCARNDEDYTIGAVDEATVVINNIPYDGSLTATIDQPELYNATVFVENASGRAVILYSNFGEYTYVRPEAANRAVMLNFSSDIEVKDLPYRSSFGLVTYYLDKVNGISFTSKDSWLQILHQSEQVDLSGAVPMMAFASPMLLAAPTTAGLGIIKVLEPIPFFLSGINGTIPVQDVTIPSAGAVTTQYLYLGLKNSLPVLDVRAQPVAERGDYTMLAVIRTNNGITVSSEPFIRLGSYRLSTTRKGSAIPVSGPRPDIPQFTLWD